MSRSQIDKSKDNRQIVWDRLKAEPGEWIEIALLADAIGVVRKTATDYLICLEAGGYVERRDAHHPEGAAARLVRDAGHHAPRLHRDGSVVTQGAGVANIWRSMRMLAKFTSRDLALHSSTPTVTVSEETAKSYCSMLFTTGYLRVLQKADPVKGRLAVYRLIRNDGPKPPMIQRVKQVYDPNTGRVYRKAGQE